MEKQDFEKVTDLLTPKFRKNSNFEFKESKKSYRRLWWRLSSAAAILAIVLTATFSSQHTIRAEETVRQSIENINAETSYKVEFYIIGIYNPVEKVIETKHGGEEITGTLYVINNNGTEKDIVEIAGMTELHDGKQSLRLLDLFNLDAINKDFSKLTITTSGDSVKVSKKKNEVTMHGVFSKKTKKLIEAYVTGHDGKKILGTRQIEYGAKIPEKYIR